MKGEDLPCHCAYCGHVAAHDQFLTKAQIEYAKSIATRHVTDQLHRHHDLLNSEPLAHEDWRY